MLIETGSQTLGARPARRPRPASASDRRISPASRSPTSTSTTPAGWATSPGPFPERHRLRPREGRPAPGGPDPSGRLGGARLRAAARLALRAPRPDAAPSGCTCWPTARRSTVGAGPDAHHRRLARPRQAPRGAARLDSGHPLRRRRGRGPPARRRRAPTVDPAARLRPRPGDRLAAPLRRTPADRASHWPTTACSAIRRSCWRRPRRPCASGPRRRRRPSGRERTSPTRCRRASTRCWAASTPPTRRSST